MIASKANYSRDDYHFPRSQSISMREAVWETRIRVMRPWFIDTIGILIGVALVLAGYLVL